MGEVYRADDLKLGQVVALKFLPEGLADDPKPLEYFRNEVRLARQVSHPNVCRVYDIGEIDGQHFLSMEYVDGEDLATLIRRIGRLPADKGVDIARQLCAGLAAAHDKGVLHRDLKPANVMLDGRGRVRITDFGIARLKDQPGGAGVRAGTPAYMAPEQLAGREVTEQSDVYSLGLVLFEVFTGKPAFKADTMAGLAQLREQTLPAAPSSIIPDIDPAVERLILRCLEKEPQDRPSSALAVAAALPGGDPLAAALAAGETPSPEMVAAAGGCCRFYPAAGAACLAVLLMGLCAVAFLSDKVSVLGGVHEGLKEPAVLKETARNIIRALGYDEPEQGDSAFGFEYDVDYLQQAARKDRPLGDWINPGTGCPAALYFWFRESPQLLSPRERVVSTAAEKFAPTVTLGDPPQSFSGMVSVRLDPQGRLLEFRAVPREKERAVGDPAPPDWREVFEFGDLNLADFEATAPQWFPPVYADHRSAWEGTCADSGMRIRVEAASCDGRPVCFQITWPQWTTSQRRESSLRVDPNIAVRSEAGKTMFNALTVMVLIAAVLLSRRNLRLGRSDRKGAHRVAVYIFSFRMLVWVFGATHVLDVGRELGLFVAALINSVYFAVFFALAYLALEPYVRRLWPETLISWSRVISGRFRDPLVGRDLLIGAAVGVFWTILVGLAVLIADWLGVPAELRKTTVPSTLLGARFLGAQFLHEQQNSVAAGLYFLLAMLLLRSLLRNQWLAGGLFVLIFAVVFRPETLSYVYWFTAGIIFVSWVFLLTRYGLLTWIAAFVCFSLLVALPITADFAAWYWGSSLFALAAVAALGVYGFYTSLAGGGLVGDRLAQS